MNSPCYTHPYQIDIRLHFLIFLHQTWSRQTCVGPAEVAICRQARSHLPRAGIESTTSCLQVRCSSYWAIQDHSSVLGQLHHTKLTVLQIYHVSFQSLNKWRSMVAAQYWKNICEQTNRIHTRTQSLQRREWLLNTPLQCVLICRPLVVKILNLTSFWKMQAIYC